MKLKTLRACLERVSFYLWILFTIFAISITGLAIEGTLLAGYLFLVSSPHPAHFPLAMLTVGACSVFLSIGWRQFGINHLHYMAYDSPAPGGTVSEDPSNILLGLIREVENSAGYARNDARAKAKLWLLSHVSLLDEEDILLAKAHFGYLLPAGWGILA